VLSKRSLRADWGAVRGAEELFSQLCISVDCYVPFRYSLTLLSFEMGFCNVAVTGRGPGFISLQHKTPQV